MISPVFFPQASQPSVNFNLSKLVLSEPPMPAGSILRRKSPHRPKKMFHGESESRQYDPTSSAWVPFYLFQSPPLTKRAAPLGAGLHDNMHICKGCFCQGRNLAVRFLRFDFLVFSAGNVCRLC